MGDGEGKGEGDAKKCLKRCLILWDMSLVSAKFWIKDDEIIMEHNDAQIPAKDLKKIQMYISLNKKDIIYEWFRHFGQ